MHNFVKNRILFIIYLEDFCLKNSHLSPKKILNFFFFILNQFHFNQALFIYSILKICISNNVKIFSKNSINFTNNKTPNIQNKISLY